MLFDLFEKQSNFVHSQAFLSFPAPIKKEVEEINSFFIHDRPLNEMKENIGILTSDKFAECLTSSIFPSIGLE